MRPPLVLPNAQEIESTYSTSRLSDAANLDDGRMWPTSFALKELAAEEEERIRELVRRARAVTEVLDAKR